jgi:hypothetical protein
MGKRASLISISVLLLAMIAASTDANARVDNQGIWAAQIALGTCVDWCRVYTDPTPLINCLTECNRNVAACLRAVTKQFRAQRSNSRER